MTKKQLKQSANRYKDTYYKLFNNLPKWKQSAINEDVAANKNSGLLVDFIKSVIELAEREESLVSTTSNKVPKFKSIIDNKSGSLKNN